MKSKGLGVGVFAEVGGDAECLIRGEGMMDLMGGDCCEVLGCGDTEGCVCNGGG